MNATASLTKIPGFGETVWKGANGTTVAGSGDKVVTVMDEQQQPQQNGTGEAVKPGPAMVIVNGPVAPATAAGPTFHGSSNCIKPGPPPGVCVFRLHILDFWTKQDSFDCML